MLSKVSRFRGQFRTHPYCARLVLGCAVCVCVCVSRQSLRRAGGADDDTSARRWGGRFASTGRQRWSGCRGHPSVAFKNTSRRFRDPTPKPPPRLFMMSPLQNAGTLARQQTPSRCPAVSCSVVLNDGQRSVSSQEGLTARLGYQQMSLWAACVRCSAESCSHLAERFRQQLANPRQRAQPHYGSTFLDMAGARSYHRQTRNAHPKTLFQR